jgi:protoporphyrinogen oxidase
MAGLAVGYYARKRGLPFTVYESDGRHGGNCATFRHKEFSFDLGAHRFHDKIEDITNELLELLGEELQKISVPSVIFHEGRLIHFPLSPLNLLKKLGPAVCLRAVREVVCSRLTPGNPGKTFADYATRAYGQTIARAFLLNYTEKLYGKSCNRLSPSVAGERLKGLSLWAFLSEAFSGNNHKAAHMEGAFYYPTKGIGVIADKLSAFCGANNIRTLAKVTRILHDHKHIQKVEISGEGLVQIEEAVSTLPLDYFLRIMDPAPPRSAVIAADHLGYRSLVLVAIFLNKPSVMPYATVYFPETVFPQTRIYEPRNRSRYMSPPGKTCLISEIPCQKRDELWSLDDESLIRMMVLSMIRTKWIAEDDILDAAVVRLDHAYPILELGFEEHLKVVMDYLEGFGNLRLSGRNATFTYSWIHNMLKAGKEISCGYTADHPTQFDFHS